MQVNNFHDGPRHQTGATVEAVQEIGIEDVMSVDPNFVSSHHVLLSDVSTAVGALEIIAVGCVGNLVAPGAFDLFFVLHTPSLRLYPPQTNSTLVPIFAWYSGRR